MNAPVMLIVRFWVDPRGNEQVFAWLNGGHAAQVVAQPGFSYVKVVRLDDKSEDGWDAYMMLYGIESRAALQAYQGNAELAQRFAREREPFVQYLRIERSTGVVEREFTHSGA